MSKTYKDKSGKRKVIKAGTRKYLNRRLRRKVKDMDDPVELELMYRHSEINVEE